MHPLASHCPGSDITVVLRRTHGQGLSHQSSTDSEEDLSDLPYATQLAAGLGFEYRNSDFPFPHFCYVTRVKNNTFQS